MEHLGAAPLGIAEQGIPSTPKLFALLQHPHTVVRIDTTTGIFVVSSH
jgi:hypothetical protein